MPTNTAMQRMTLAHSRLNLWGSPRWLSMQGYSSPTTAAREGTPFAPAARQWLLHYHQILAWHVSSEVLITLLQAQWRKDNYYPPFLLLFYFREVKNPSLISSILFEHLNTHCIVKVSDLKLLLRELSFDIVPIKVKHNKSFARSGICVHYSCAGLTALWTWFISCESGPELNICLNLKVY